MNLNYKFGASVRPAIFQVLTSHMRLEATILDSTGGENVFITAEMSFRQCWSRGKERHWKLKHMSILFKNTHNVLLKTIILPKCCIILPSLEMLMLWPWEDVSVCGPGMDWTWENRNHRSSVSSLILPFPFAFPPLFLSSLFPALSHPLPPYIPHIPLGFFFKGNKS